LRATIKQIEWVETIKTEVQAPHGKRSTISTPAQHFRVLVDVETPGGSISDHAVIVPAMALASRGVIYGHEEGDHRAALESIVRELVFSWEALEPAGAEEQHRYGGADERITVDWHPDAHDRHLLEQADRIKAAAELFRPQQPSLSGSGNGPV
jgi:hypothetical protein